MIVYIILAIVIFYVLNKKESFSHSTNKHPFVYKKHFNNDGKIGWVPYYGKPGRKCEEDQDCPIFQKCNGGNCKIPTNIY